MYFRYYPVITYNDKLTRNILLRAKVIEQVFQKLDVFYPYVIKQGERADILADRLYSDSTLDWVIYLSNNITDPYYDWPMDDKDFNGYLEMKYGKPAVLTQADISHYVYTGIGESDSDIARKSWHMTVETYNLLASDQRAGWTAVYVYDYERELNEDRRNINILKPLYIEQIKREMADIL